MQKTGSLVQYELERMIDYITALIRSHSDKGVIVDSNLLLLWCIGACDERLVASFKRTKTFSVEDYRLLAIILHQFRRVLSTPNILTEVNSFLGQLDTLYKAACFSRFAEHIGRLDERYLASGGIRRTPAFIKFGLTDAAIIRLSARGYLVMTEDLPLAAYIQHLGVPVLNFNNIRPLGWRYLG